MQHTAFAQAYRHARILRRCGAAEVFRRVPYSGVRGFSTLAREDVLEIGCGIGTDSINFVRNGAKLTIVELSSESLAITKKRLALEGLTADFVNGNAEELDQFLPPAKV